MITLAGLELHLPFHHVDSLDFLELVKATYKPDVVVCVGDLFDVHSNSRHEHDPNGMSPGDELDRAIITAEDVYELFPVVKYCKGNHCTRIEKAAYRAGLPRRAIKTLEQIYELPNGWDVADYHVVDNVVYEHGDRASGAMGHIKLAMLNMRSTVIGHLHTEFAVSYFANRDKLIFGAVCGALLDTGSYAAAYAKVYAKKSIHGAMIIKDGITCIPVPMVLDSTGRWTGNI